MKQLLLTAVLTGAMVMPAGMMMSRTVQAQEDVNINPDTGAPGINQTDPNVPGTTAQDDLTGGISPWWIILPLLALALYFLLRPRNEETWDDRYENRTYAGSKGGEAKRDMDDMNP